MPHNNRRLPTSYMNCYFNALAVAEGGGIAGKRTLRYHSFMIRVQLASF